MTGLVHPQFVLVFTNSIYFSTEGRGGKLLFALPELSRRGFVTVFKGFVKVALTGKRREKG